VVRVTEPSRPLLVATVPSSGDLVALALGDGILAAAEKQAAVRLFDVSRPDNPRPIADLGREAEGARDVALAGSRLLVAAGRRGLLAFDVTKASDPRPAGSLAWEGSAAVVTVHGGLALVGCGGAGLRVVDFRSGAPVTLAELRLPRGLPAGRMSVAEEMAFIAGDVGGLAVVDLAEPAVPRAVHPPGRTLTLRGP
jgi:hypothetical protein